MCVKIGLSGFFGQVFILEVIKSSCLLVKKMTVSNPNLPKWPFLQKMGQFGNIPARKCFVAKKCHSRDVQEIQNCPSESGIQDGMGSSGSTMRDLSSVM